MFLGPVSDVNVTGNNWIQHDEVLNLTVSYKGSSMFNYCVHFFPGIYNITGNETCYSPDTTAQHEFPITRYFSEDKQHTIVIVIYNDVGKVVSPVTVTVYTGIYYVLMVLYNY